MANSSSSSFFSSFFGSSSNKVPPSPRPSVPSNYSTFPTMATGLSMVLIVDKSGSMEGICEKMRESINAFILTQQKEKADGSTFTLVMFSSSVEIVIDKKPLSEVKPLEKEDYVASGSTALFDAIGTTVERFKDESNVLLVIVTDGEENASRKFTNKKEISLLVADCQEKKKWNVVYLSCDIDTFRQGEAMHMTNSGHSSNAQVTKSTMGNYISTNLNSAVTSYRQGRTSINDNLNTQ